MKTRQLSLIPSVRRTAVISECGLYRYLLTRCWDIGNTREDPVWIMLNPSTADADIDDATIRRCINFSKAWGYGGLQVVNLFGFRATHPRDLKKAEDPIGPDNREHVLRAVANTSTVICAWGAHGSLNGRGHEMLQQLWSWGAQPFRLGTKDTNNGHPRHPLRLAKDTKLRPLRFKPGA